MNCWEFKKCGREPGGEHVDELGVCPAATDKAPDGTNQGKNAGRVCWAVAGTLCGGKVQGIFVMKIISCVACPFFKQVIEEEGFDFHMYPQKTIQT